VSGQRDVVRSLVQCWLDGMMEKAVHGNTLLYLAAARKAEVVQFSAEFWPERKNALNIDDKSPLSYSMFEYDGGCMIPLSDKEEIIALSVFSFFFFCKL
jgi:hypothetical protein